MGKKKLHFSKSFSFSGERLAIYFLSGNQLNIFSPRPHSDCDVISDLMIWKHFGICFNLGIGKKGRRESVCVRERERERERERDRERKRERERERERETRRTEKEEDKE